MNQKTLKLTFEVQKQLESLNFPDSYRISKDIVEYSQSNSIEIDKIIERITNNEPWEYIKGTSEFMGSSFKVTDKVLIPRVETAQLVEVVCKELTTLKDKEVQIIDVGVGSGAIICSIVKKTLNKKNEYIGTDISEDAIRITKQNVKRLELEGFNIRVVKTNLIEDIALKEDSIVIANLPYIPTSDYISLDPSVKEWEPELALHGGNEGVDSIKRLLEMISRSSVKPLSIYLEIDPKQPTVIKNIFKELSLEYNLNVIKDFQNLDRFIYAKRS